MNSTPCICEGKGSGNWVACDSATCPVKWYHRECVGVVEESVGGWVCATCREGAAASIPTAASPAQPSPPAAASSSRPSGGPQKAPRKRSGGQQNSGAIVKKAVQPQRRKSQRQSRVIYESTEHSVFEEIIAQSVATARFLKGLGKIPEERDDSTTASPASPLLPERDPRMRIDALLDVNSPLGTQTNAGAHSHAESRATTSNDKGPVGVPPEQGSRSTSVTGQGRAEEVGEEPLELLIGKMRAKVKRDVGRGGGR